MAELHSWSEPKCMHWATQFKHQVAAANAGLCVRDTQVYLT